MRKPPSQTRSKILRLTVRPHWRWGASGTGGQGSGGGGSSGGVVGEVVFAIEGAGVALYRVSDNSRLAGSQSTNRIPISPTGAQDEAITEDLAIVTNEDFTGPVLIKATFVWDSRYLGGNSQHTVDMVRLVPSEYTYDDPGTYSNPIYLVAEAWNTWAEGALKAKARTTGTGQTPSDPRTCLVIGRRLNASEWGNFVTLEVYSDSNYREQNFNGSIPTWTCEEGPGGNFVGAPGHNHKGKRVIV
ncbi:MAG: hypothetical protein NZ602_12010 [Thermoguttaceae bacterium]|nr:hypothetical protein [Thermoguttaceae bacterium]